MATAEKTKPEEILQTKLTQLGRAGDKTDKVLKTGKEQAIRRHVETLKETLKEVSKWQRTVEAKQITANEDAEEIDKWSDGVESKMEEADQKINILEEWLNDTEAKREDQERKERMNFEIQLHEAKMKLQAELVKPDSESSAKHPAVNLQAKLPKLEITKFNGTYADWPRFWGQYSESIDKTSVPPVTKFSYLRELLCEKARRAIEALPYTAEGYNRAVVILKDRFGKDSEIIKAYVKEILDLPYTATTNPKKVQEFYEKLAYCVQSLETLKQLDAVNGTVSMTLEKLPNIRGDLVRNDPNWETWNFIQLTEAIRLWTRRNPVGSNKAEDSNKKQRQNGGYHFQTQQIKGKQRRACVYCNAESHRSWECDSVSTMEERRKLLSTKKLCFNCTGPSHRASECRSTMTCKHCNKRHHTSICDGLKEFASEPVKTAHKPEDREVIYPVVLVQIDGIKTHALLDTGAGSSYASAKLINTLKKKPKEVKTKRIQMMLGSSTTRIEIYSANLKSIDGEFALDIELSKVDKPPLMTIKNPNYKKLLEKYNHLKGAKLDDRDNRPQIPIHVVLGASEYATIKTTTSQKVWSPGQPVAEKTLLGWTVMSPGREESESPILLTQSATMDYEQLCALDVLGLADRNENDQLTVYQEFKEQLRRDEAGWYETKLPWRGNHPPLPTNEFGSKRRLEQLVRKLERTDQYAEYDSIIQEQLQQGIIEAAPKESTKKEFYIPHKGVCRKEAESTKLRVVYDASARESNSQPSLNECLHPGPPLQNLLWDVLLRARFYPILLTGDLKKAFLQIRIHEEERDSLRFHWRQPNSCQIEVFRFTRALFGLTCSPFLLGGVINQHLDSWEDRHPELIKELREGLYVDDLMTGGTTIKETEAKKATAIELFEDATFTIHKWHSNAPELEPTSDAPAEPEELTYAKSHLGGVGQPEGKLLGLPWDRQRDTMSVTLTHDQGTTTKRGILSKLAKIYDPLGLASPTSLTGKLIYRDSCDAKIPWDANLPQPLVKRWKEWNSSLETFTIPRSLTPHRQPILEITLHGFGDASSRGVCAAVYAVVKQKQGITQGLVCAKSRIAKRNLTIPRLELISGHMAANLVSNVQAAVNAQHLSVHCWLDSTVALYWINDQGEYRQFVANRLHKIQQHDQITWHHVPTTDNPADLGSRGGNVVTNRLWREGPSWLSNPSEWPPDKTIEPTSDTRSEAKVVKEIFKAAKAEQDAFDQLLDKHPLSKLLRIGAWIRRFISNCKSQPQDRKVGPINTQEIKQQQLWWIRRVQEAAHGVSHFQADQLQLNLQLNDKEILECRGRIVGEYPIYLPDTHPFTALVVRQAHICTLHGGVGITMAKVRERYWVPRLRRLVKKIRRSCHGCKRFQAKAYQAPPPGNLPTTRTQGSTPYQVLGVDFAGPIKYLIKSKKEAKAYLVLYACSLTRAVHLDLVKSLEAKEFIISLKKFIARRGRPEIIYSDNATTFKAAANWVRQVRQDEKLNNLLADLAIEWRFNLSRAPWWGGQFERLIGLFKNAFYKSIGNGILRWTELEEVVLDIEVAINNRPLSYLEDDIQLPVLTPNSILHINPTHLPELEGHRVPEKDLRKRAKFLLKCKQAMWNRWTREYVRSLREQHRLVRPKKTPQPSIGEVVVIKEEQKPRNVWKLAVVNQLITGRDGVVRAAKLKTGNGHLERAIQHLFPLELACDREPTIIQLNPKAPEYNPRHKRDAAAAAAIRIEEIAETQDQSE